MSPKSTLAIWLGALLVGAPGLACVGDESDSDADRPPLPSGAVETGDFFFAPEAKRVATGETITWFNTGEQLHNVRGRGFASRAFGRGESYRFRFRRAGSYRYVCTLHPDRMRGTIVVE